MYLWNTRLLQTKDEINAARGAKLKLMIFVFLLFRFDHAMCLVSSSYLNTEAEMLRRGSLFSVEPKPKIIVLRFFPI